MDRELLSEMLGWTGEDIVVLAESEYDDAIVGYDTDGNVVYSYDKLVEIAMGTLGVERLEAIEYIDYNIVNSLRKERGAQGHIRDRGRRLGKCRTRHFRQRALSIKQT